MKACGYCGRENDDTVLNYRECGTALTNEHSRSVKTTRPSSPITNTTVAGIFGGIFFIALAGLILSFLGLGSFIGVSSSARSTLAVITVVAAVLSVCFQCRASTKALRGVEKIKEDDKKTDA